MILHMIRRRFQTALFGLVLGTTVLAGAGTARADLQLIMFEQVGCIYCIKWDQEVGDAYPVTDEGRGAPLVKLNIREKLPAGVSIAYRPQFTPTFVLLDNGVEVDRIEGYPGEDFFWGLLAQMIANTQNAARSGIEQPKT
jgi:thioredoxin-related protein